MSDRIWFTTGTAAAHVQRHIDVVRDACQDGSLHGVQRSPKGHWRIHRDCLDAWAFGVKCEHQKRGAA